MSLSLLSRLRPHTLWNRYYRLKAHVVKVRERLTGEKHLESLIDENIELLWSPAAANRVESTVGAGGKHPLRILYVAHRHDYGNPARGLSYEENNFLHVLYSLGHEIIRFDYPTIMRKHSRRRMNDMLVETVYRYAPDLMFAVLFTDEFDRKTIERITNLEGGPITINWFTDDHWRFERFSRFWAPCFDWVITTARSALPKYAEAGLSNVIYSQWACNHRLYYDMNLPEVYDVTFVGLPHGNRRDIVRRLRSAGLDVRTWGYGWETGKVSQFEMIRIFNQSRINLNLSNASIPGHDQIKGRNFEIPGCGAFLLTGCIDGLEAYYRIGEEVVCYSDVDDLIDKIRYHLRHEDEREVIARAGYLRTLAEHTYDHRFTSIFSVVGLA